MDEKFHEQASQLELDRRADALAKVRRTLNQQGQADCEDCGEPIPPARREANRSAIRCLACQQIFERICKK
jgi:phage/conjugal plasmid C-4 type zinc finger TraR family protein